jgi:hypothetical protein
VGLALIVVLVMALGSIRRGYRHRMRSLVWSTKRLAAAQCWEISTKHHDRGNMLKLPENY